MPKRHLTSGLSQPIRERAIVSEQLRERWLAEPKLAQMSPAFAQVGFGVAAFPRFASEGWRMG